MLEFITNNLGTLIVGLVLLIIVILVLRSLKKDKKNGKSTCGYGCEHCANAQYCHGNHKK